MCRYRGTILTKIKIVVFKGVQNKFTEIVPDVKLLTLLTEMLLQQRDV